MTFNFTKFQKNMPFPVSLKLINQNPQCPIHERISRFFSIIHFNQFTVSIEWFICEFYWSDCSSYILNNFIIATGFLCAYKCKIELVLPKGRRNMILRAVLLIIHNNVRLKSNLFKFYPICVTGTLDPPLSLNRYFNGGWGLSNS